MSLKKLIKIFLYLLRSFMPLPKRGASILTYHSVGDNEVFFTVSKEDFMIQMDYLAKNNFKVISLEEFYQDFSMGEIKDKTVVLTFDDGYLDNFVNVFPVLQKYNFPATIFLITGMIGQTSLVRGTSFEYLSWDKIKIMNDSGLIDFQPHTVNHRKLTDLNLSEIEKEISNSRSEIEAKLSKKCRYFCYPFGQYNNLAINFLKSADFDLSLTVREGLVFFGQDKHSLRRNSIDKGVNQFIFREIAKRGRI